MAEPTRGRDYDREVNARILHDVAPRRVYESIIQKHPHLTSPAPSPHGRGDISLDSPKPMTRRRLSRARR